MIESKEYFDKIDSNKDGTIDVREMNRLIENPQIFEDFVDRLNSKEFLTEFIDKFPFEEGFKDLFGKSYSQEKLKGLVNRIDSIEAEDINNQVVRNVRIYGGEIFGDITNKNQIRFIQLYFDISMLNNKINFEDVMLAMNDEQIKKEYIQNMGKLSEFAYTDIVNSQGKWEKETNRKIGDYIQVESLFDQDGKLLDESKSNQLSFHNKIMIEYIKYNIDRSSDIKLDFVMDKGKMKVVDKSFDEKQLKFINEKLCGNIDIQYENLADNSNLNNISIDRNYLLQQNNFKILQRLKEFQTVCENKIQNENKQLDETQQIENNYEILGKFNDLYTGYSSILLQDKESGIKILAIRGSDGFMDWAVNNLFIGASEIFGTKILPFQVKSIKSSIEYYENEGLLDEQEKLIVTGHSLGGALSEITDVIYNDRLIQGLNFNGPGVKRLFKDKDLLSSAGDKIIKIKNHDIIGNMGEQLANITIPVDGKKHRITALRQDIDNEKQLIVINKKVFKGLDLRFKN